ncbi:MAG TPA: hydrolase [Candidatus Sulfotelmatobacter sp.]|nr:hydrolase [Candidatus Sulfotelmatobacter sp.]
MSNATAGSIIFSMVTTPLDTATPSEAARRSLRPEDCALAVVDIQEKLLPPIFEKERLVRNSQLLVRLANILSFPVIVSTQYVKGLGPTIAEINSLLPEGKTIDKLEFGCLGNSDYCSAIGGLANRTTLLLCGMESHICVAQTALGALNQGLNVHVAADAVSSRTELNWKIGLNRMQAAGAVLSSTEMMIYELLGKSGTPAFKEMLKHLK